MFFFLKNKEGDTQSGGKLKWLLPAVGAALGILLLLWGGNSEQAQNDTDASTAQISTPQSELEAYQIYLEGRVSRMHIFKGYTHIPPVVVIGVKILSRTEARE